MAKRKPTRKKRSPKKRRNKTSIKNSLTKALAGLAILAVLVAAVGFLIFKLAPPEKSSQSAALLAWYDVDVKMRNALAHTVVDRDERALGSKGRFDRLREQLHVREEAPKLGVRKVDDRFAVLVGNQQDVAGKERPAV